MSKTNMTRSFGTPGRPPKPETAHLQSWVVKLRGQRHKWDEIAAITGKSAGYCCDLYKRAMEQIPVADVLQAREEECRLIDEAIKSLLAEIEADHDKTNGSLRNRIEAWNTIRSYSEHRARLLGLNAPIKSQVQVITEDHIDAAIKELEAALAHNDAVAARNTDDARTEA